MEDTPIKSLDLPKSEIPTPFTTETPESPIPRRKKPVPELKITTNGNSTNGHIKAPVAETPQSGNANGIKKRSASDALGNDVSPSSKRSKTLSGSGDTSAAAENGIVILDDANDGAIMIDDD